MHLPHIARVPVQLSRGEGGLDGVGVADGAPGGVNQPGAGLEVREEVRVNEMVGAGVKGCVDRDDVALGDEVFEVLDAAGVDGLGGICDPE